MTDSIQAAYDIFRAAALNNEPRDFDEEVLIDIFDYAGDVNDDFVRLEVLTTGFRLYPDSNELSKRKAIFLSGISGSALATYVSGKQIYDGDQLWAILKCRAESPSGDDAVKALNDILNMEDSFDDDETVLQFVALVRHLQMEDWLMENLDTVRNHCGDMDQTLLFEIARLAETKRQVQTGIKILEELTLTDPFNLDYWGLLAELQCNIGQYKDALVSLDYAKAIAPDDYELPGLEGYILLKTDKPEEAYQCLKLALKRNPDNYSAKRNLLEAAKLTMRNDEYDKLLKEQFRDDPADTSLMLSMAARYPDSIAETLSRYYAYNEPDEATAIQHVGELCSNGNQDSALNYLEWYRDNYELSQTGSFAILELLYINGKFGLAYDFICNGIKDPTLQPNELPILGIVASTLLRLRMFDDAKRFCGNWIAKLKAPKVKNNAFRLINRGLVDTLVDIKELLDRTSNPSEAEIDDVVL